MEVREPLSEMSNQRQPRRKVIHTYSRKKANALNSQIINQELFGRDENVLDAEFAALTISDPIQRVKQTSRSNRDNNDSATTTTDEPVLRTKHSIPPQSPVPSSVCRKQASNFQIPPEDLSALSPLLALSQHQVESFTIFGGKVAKSCEVVKIGEGSFAEVFKITATSTRRLPKVSATSSSIIKIIPLHHPTSSQSAIDRVSAIPSVAREINILKHLDILHGFTGFASIRLVKGSWPASFLDAFYDFKTRNRKRALNGAPDEDFDQNQIYTLVEMDDAGTEVALLQRPNLFQIHDIFWTTVVLLVNAEERFEFEHRDLHLSNICVKPSNKIFNSSVTTDPMFNIPTQMLFDMENPPPIKLGMSNLDVTIIDYTVSRAKLPPPDHDSSSDIEYDEMSFASEPIDPTSDPEAALQFSTYQKCRFAAQLAARDRDSTTQAEKPLSKYSLTIPVTNVIWLGYLLRVLLRRNAPIPITTSKPSTKSTSSSRQRKTKTLQPREPFIIDPRPLTQPIAEKPTSVGESTVTTRRTRSRAAGSTVPAPAPARALTHPAMLLQESMFADLCTVDAALNGSPDDGVNPDLEHLSWTESHMSSLPSSAKNLLERAMQERWITREEIAALRDRLERESSDG